MSTNPEFEPIVALRPYSNGVAEPVAEPAVQAPSEPESEKPGTVLAVPEAVPAAARPRSGRPRWVVPACIAAVGIIAAGSLTYFLVNTTGQRDTARTQLAATKATLAKSNGELAAAQTDAAGKKVIATYVDLFVVNSGRVETDYGSIAGCKSYSECRTDAQQLLTDLQGFQAARSSATVPGSLANADSMAGDAVSSGIAGTQELIAGMDSGDTTKATAGAHQLDAAMLSLAKAESALGAGLR